MQALRTYDWYGIMWLWKIMVERRQPLAFSMITLYSVLESSRKIFLNDQVHLRCASNRTKSVSAKVKSRTSKILLGEFPHLNRMLNLVTRSYSVSTVGNVSSQTMKRYVEIQRKH